ncbi:MAG: ECF transporter S component [Epulopiscium sp. Nele67-Bin005]|nr:MAG: ECF transporter S component [Epulopiscium sp. Nele67-Bin005]
MKKLSLKISWLLLLIIIPLTLWISAEFLENKKYYFISLLIIIYLMIPFFMQFEQKKPQAREIILVAVMVSIGVAGRSAFFMLPHFKPTVAIVIITGLAFGAETGFLSGAMTAFISNFFFGQGPWTIWQMFCLGVIGFVSGLLSKTKLKYNKKLLCIYGAFVTLFLYGGIINIYSALMGSSVINLEILLIYYIQALPFDLIHAFSTTIFLFFIAEPMLEKINRVKTKYGLL